MYLSNGSVTLAAVGCCASLAPFFVDGAAFNRSIIPLARPREMLLEHAHFCLHAGVRLVFQTIFKICIKVFLNFKTISKEEVLFDKLNLIVIRGKLV